MNFIKDNAVWLVPILVAIVSGIFYLIKKGGNSQSIGRGNSGTVNMINGNENHVGKE